MMKRVTSGVLAVLLLAGLMVMPVSADPADEPLETTVTTEAQETEETTATETEPTTGESEPATGESEPTTGGSGEQPNPPAEEEEEEIKYDGPTISTEGMRILKLEEGFSKYPYWDYSQWTVGYGTRCPDNKREEYSEYGITEEAAEILLHNHLIGVYNDLNGFATKNGLTFSQNQYDALVLFSYNCGTGWIYDSTGTLPKALKAHATGNELIRAFAVWCSAGGSIKDYLLRRRLSESYMYLEGGYTQNAPSNYCYVLYDANGGTTSPRSQGYDSNLTAKPYPVPTYSGYTFAGWYTQKVGGTKVTVLDASTKSKTLYAHWTDSQGNDVTGSEPEQEVNATVTTDGVNVRKGPGTNYTTVGSKNKGDKIMITETASGSGYRWGKIGENAWICLTYTDYDKTEEGGNDDTTSGGDTTESVEPAKVMGTVKVDGYLNVREGAGTGYKTVGSVQNNERVEILEQKTVGAITWGKISKGWISMAYVKLDSTDSGTSGGNTTQETIYGTIVNCSEFLRIRSGPGTNYALVDYLHPGDKVTITETKMNGSDKWGKIDKGWISMYYVRVETNPDSGNDSGTVGKTGTVTTNDLRVRSAAGTSSTVVGYLSKGAKVTVTQTTTVNGTTWGKIEKGWISMDYVKLDDAADSGSDNSGSAGTTGTVGTVTSSTELNVRSGAGTDYSVVGWVYPGDKVTILEQKTVGSMKWGRIDKGWISMSYVKLDSSASNQVGQTKTVIASYLNVRKNPGSTGYICGGLSYGTKVTILETTDVNGTPWGRTSEGWICIDSQYVK